MFRSSLMRMLPRASTARLATAAKAPRRNFSWLERHSDLARLNAADAVRRFVPRENGTVYVHMAAAAPALLTKALAEDKELKGCTAVHLLLNPTAAHHLQPECHGRIRANYLFVGAEGREAVNKGNADYTPAFYQQIPSMFLKQKIPLDCALITVSEPDEHGWCSLGTSIGCDLAAVQSAKAVIAQVTKHMPRTHGDGFIHIDQIDAVVESDNEIWEYQPPKASEQQQEVVKAIAKNVASLIPDGACLQFGIGDVPAEIAKCLHSHKDLGIHTEMISDSVVDLVESGVVNGYHKKSYAGQVVCTYMLGTKKLYKYTDNNPDVIGVECEELNHEQNIALNPKQHSINSAIEIDLTGQVVADSIGRSIYSGIGGQMDFMRGAALSDGGKPIICLPSTTSKGESRIVPTIKEGAGVVTTRAHVHYVATEYGIAYLYGRNLLHRARALINIAHPAHRDALKAAAAKRFGKFWM